MQVIIKQIAESMCSLISFVEKVRKKDIDPYACLCKKVFLNLHNNPLIVLIPEEWD